MKKLIVLFAFSICLNPSLYAQEEFNDDFFISFHSTAYFDFIWTPLKVQFAPTGNTIIVDGQEQPEFKNIPFQSFTNNIFSFGIEPRYNIKQLDENSAIALASPISIGLGQVTQPPLANHSVGSIEGFGSIQIPLYAKLYVGSGSTYETEKDYGISLGLGFEFNKIGLLRFDNPSDIEANDLNKGFVLPVASLGIHFWRGYSPVELNIKYGQGQTVEYDFDRNGDVITDNVGRIIKGSSKARVFRASISYLLNY